MKRREFNKGLAAATTIILAPLSRTRNVLAATTASGATQIFSYPNFTGSLSALVMRNASTLGAALQLLNNGPAHTGACAWYTAKQPPNAFSTTFTFQPQGLGSSIAQSGMTFCIQNTVAPPGQPGYVGDQYIGDANMCGYGGATNQYPPVDSIMIKFDAGNESTGQDYPAGGLPSSTGMYFNGGPSVYPGGSLGLCPCNDLNPSGINFYSGHVFQVNIVYDGSLLTMVILDTSTNAQARLAWPLNLANTTNAVGNYVGFTVGTAAVGYFNLQSWSYYSGYNTRLATPTFSPAPGQYSGTQTVTIAAPSGSTCYYTTNGLLPTSSSQQYTGPITVSANQVIQAVAIQSGYTDSLVGTGAYQIGTSNVINFPNGFTTGNLITVGYASLNGSAIRITDTTQSVHGAAWYPIPVSVTSFSTTFKLNWGSSGQGMCFVIQNNPPAYTTASNAINWSGGPTVIGGGKNGLGYGGLNAVNGTAGQSFGLMNSIAVVFNQLAIGSGDPSNGVGIYSDGANPFGSQIATGLSFVGAFNVTLTYDGTTLKISIQSTSGGTVFTHSWAVNIPSAVGANTAYVGFTGSTYGAASVQSVQSWTYAANSTQALAVPAAPTNLQVK